MQDPNTMSFAARAAAKDTQIDTIRRHEATEARLEGELAATKKQRELDEAYLVQVALADAAANQLILEKYARHLPPPAPPAPPPPPPAPETVEVPAAEQPVAEVPAAADVPAADADAAAPAPAADPGVITLS